MGPLMTDLATAYSAQHPHVTFDIQGGGSQLGQSLVESGRVDLGLVSWPPQNLLPGLRSIPIARDTIAIIVHPENKLEGLSLADLQNIFSGRLLDLAHRLLRGRIGPEWRSPAGRVSTPVHRAQIVIRLTTRLERCQHVSTTFDGDNQTLINKKR
jgi:ABC-type phosphate transport system substrate-binding protein